MLRAPQTKTLALLVSLTTLAVLFLPIDKNVWGIYAQGSAKGHFAYSFLHASFWHWLGNAWCLLSLVFYRQVGRGQLLLAYLIASAFPASFIYTLTGAEVLAQPTVGLSGVCFALAGILTPPISDKRHYLLWLTGAIALGFFFPLINNYIHLWSLGAGVLAGFIYTHLCKQQ